jgi:hypothetical protein
MKLLMLLTWCHHFDEIAKLIEPYKESLPPQQIMSIIGSRPEMTFYHTPEGSTYEDKYAAVFLVANHEDDVIPALRLHSKVFGMAFIDPDGEITVMKMPEDKEFWDKAVAIYQAQKIDLPHLVLKPYNGPSQS